MEILSNLQNKILKSFKKIPDKEAFYLTGGTALSAFYLKHRRSNDLDFFTNVEELITPFSQKLEASLIQETLRAERLRGFHSFVELLVRSQEEEVVIHFALDSPFRFEQPLDSPKFPGLKIDTLLDIATNKLLALFGRANLRDFIDIYFLCKEGFKKEKLVEKAKTKDPGFDLYWLGIALERVKEFTEGQEEMHLLIKPLNLRELQDFFGKWRREIFEELKK